MTDEKETRAGKAFVEFINALQDDILETIGDDSNLDEEKVSILSKRLKTDTISLLQKEFSTESKKGIHFSVMDFSMDLFFNFIIFDNCQFFKSKHYDLLARRYDMAWFYFRNLIDSFAVLRGLDEPETEESKE